ncbi:MAG: homocysteine S-methyltransferase family protein [Chloroflexi bacterium]|nr:homocysteine S-methyltransferase family protein [Chloroflexota bacterium]
MRPTFQELLGQKVVVCDGAMGTILISMGLMGGCPEELNVTAPEKIKSVHAMYVASGADIVETNSFGGNPIKLAGYNLAERTHELNRAAARLAREAAGDRALVAGSIGPTGQFLKPLGALTAEEARAAYGQQARALADGGADLLIVETMSDLSELTAAVLGAQGTTGLPIMCTLTFSRGTRTIMGVSAARAAGALRDLGIQVIGANCSTGPQEMEPVLAEMQQTYPEATLIAQPNAGQPRMDENGQVLYDLSPQDLAGYGKRFVAMGVKIVGGCCGTTPEHIRALAEAVVA